ncbi:hypothetical protein L6452_17611 [Arctium lappa]|uniref:Uncharacterized protein n=1 Tax=Arctium lappa TaxID=4217 RepID=A0ACB9C3X3_ARCLA|nr:hypothetical protein L6452_17611 [Arctium lappa]
MKPESRDEEGLVVVDNDDMSERVCEGDWHGGFRAAEIERGKGEGIVMVTELQKEAESESRGGFGKGEERYVMGLEANDGGGWGFNT